RYAWSLVDIRPTILLVAVVGTLVYNFPTFLTLMASEGFHGGAGLAGFLMAILGVGTVIGGLAAATWARASARIVIGAASPPRSPRRPRSSSRWCPSARWRCSSGPWPTATCRSRRRCNCGAA